MYSLEEAFSEWLARRFGCRSAPASYLEEARQTLRGCARSVVLRFEGEGYQLFREWALESGLELPEAIGSAPYSQAPPTPVNQVEAAKRLLGMTKISVRALSRLEYGDLGGCSDHLDCITAKMIGLPAVHVNGLALEAVKALVRYGRAEGEQPAADDPVLRHLDGRPWTPRQIRYALAKGVDKPVEKVHSATGTDDG